MPDPRIRIAALVAATLLATTGCGDGGGTATRSPDPTPAPAAPAPTAPSRPPDSSPPAGSPETSATAVDPFDPGAVTLSLEVVAGGFDAPLAIAHAADGSGRIYVAEQGGIVRIVADGAVAPEPLLDISDRVVAGGEQGLLGLAFHPDYPTDPRVFVDYTGRGGGTVVSSFVVTGGDRVDTATETIILEIGQPYANHNGGAIAFGPDGFLYVATGDGGAGGDPHGNGQSLATHLGKILRIDVDSTAGERAYAVPADNPFVDRDGAEPEIWLTGLRNPWRFSFDRATHDMIIGDVGQNAWEEIDVARAGQGGLNFGWNRFEGFECYPPDAGDCDAGGMTMPVAVYGHDEGCSVTGGVVYRGAAQPALVGGYVFADYCSGNVWVIDPASEGRQMPVKVLESGRSISSFGEDEAGEVYATDIGRGELLRVVASDS